MYYIGQYLTTIRIKLQCKDKYIFTSTINLLLIKTLTFFQYRAFENIPCRME